MRIKLLQEGLYSLYIVIFIFNIFADSIAILDNRNKFQDHVISEKTQSKKIIFLKQLNASRFKRDQSTIKPSNNENSQNTANSKINIDSNHSALSNIINQTELVINTPSVIREIVRNATRSYVLPSETCPQIKDAITVYEESHLNGAKFQGNYSELGSSSNIEDCAKQCCQSSFCDVAVYQNSTTAGLCLAVSCAPMENCVVVKNEVESATGRAGASHGETAVIIVRNSAAALQPLQQTTTLGLLATSQSKNQNQPQALPLQDFTPPLPESQVRFLTSTTSNSTTASVSMAGSDDKQSSTQEYLQQPQQQLPPQLNTGIPSTTITTTPDASSPLPLQQLRSSLLDDIEDTSNGMPSQPVLQACEVGLPDCPNNEECIGLGSRRRDGVCHCSKGFTRNVNTGVCTLNSTGAADSAVPVSTASPINTALVVEGTTSATTVPSLSNVAQNTTVVSKETTTVFIPKVLDVTVNNKTVILAEGKNIYDQKVLLSAYVLGECPTCQYEYEWAVLQQPQTGGEVGGSLTEPHSPTITLTRLVAGTYLFSVRVTQRSVSGDGPDTNGLPLAMGYTVANLTIIRPSQSNKPPVVTIKPTKQTVTLPSAAVILDGSDSIDDNTEKDKLEFRWEIVKGPIGYSLDIQIGNTLKLLKLVPGNYTIMLKVRDESGLESNSTAAVEVLQGKDYPPSANAGGDQIVYLPQTETLVNGTASSDDHGVVEWEWTKGEDDDGLAVDMQDTRKSLLKLSGLEEGHYQFILKVVDGSGQSDTSVANVYVHMPDAMAMEANAGPDVVLTLPNVTTTLDGTKSKGVTTETKGNWTQMSGPNAAHLTPVSEILRVNVTGLTRGVYVFRLQLWARDGAKTVSDDVTVTVRQEQNLQPKANGGGDFSVTLPVSLVQVNGSASSDDVGIVRWRWERLPTSLAAGHVLGQSGSAPVLLLADLVPGQYQWRLTVWDDQGASDSDTVSFIARSGPHDKDQVAVILGAGIESVSAAQLASVMQSLKLLLPPTITLQMMEYGGLPHTGESSFTIVGFDTSRGGVGGDAGGSTDIVSEGGVGGGGSSSSSKGSVVSGVVLSSMLQSGVRAAVAGSSHLFDLPVTVIQTVICQNNCSGHGECDQVRRECVCQSWWMESFFRRHFGDTTPNCDWSVIYVFVTSIASGSLSAVLVWGAVTAIAKRRRSQTGGASHRRRGQGSADGESCGGGRRGASTSPGWESALCYCGVCDREGGGGGGGPHRRRAANGSRYTLLEEDAIKMRPRSSLLNSETDSGSDTEVLFDSRSVNGGSGGGGVSKNRHKHKNGHLKLPINRLRT